jgi:hypothetical protein
MMGPRLQVKGSTMATALRLMTVLATTVLLGACGKDGPATPAKDAGSKPGAAAPAPAAAPASAPAVEPARSAAAAAPDQAARERTMLLDDLDDYSNKVNYLRIASTLDPTLGSDESYMQVVEEIETKVGEARAKADELLAAPPDAAPTIQQELATLMGEIKQIDQKLKSWAREKQQQRAP